MSQRTERRSTDSELEGTLREVGAHLAYPSTVDLSRAVLSRLEEKRGASFWPVFWSSKAAFGPALATLALLVLATIALQPLGATAAEALGLRGITIFQTAQTPPPATPRPSPSIGASPAPTGGVLFDAHRVASLDAASSEAAFTVRVPSSLGPPDDVYVRVTTQDTQVFLLYRPRPGIPASAQTGIGILVTEVKGSFEFGLLGKLLGPGSKAEQVTVNGAPGVWIEGAPHQFFYRAPGGEFVSDTLRLSGNVLVWDQGGLLLRIEADIPRDEALRIASSTR